MCELVQEFMNDTNEWNSSYSSYGTPGRMIMTTQNFCDVISEINYVLTKILLHIMHVPVITLIIITLFGKENEDAKWFVFHTAVLNFILGIIWELTFIDEDCKKNQLINTIMMFSLGLAVNSIFPLAFTRFFYMYYQHLYDKLFTKKTLLPWMLAYDGIMIGLYLLEGETSFICLTVNFIMLFGTVFCTFFVFLRIRKMMKMVEDSKLSTFNDLCKAAFVCIFQASVISLHLISTLYTQIYAGIIDPYVYGQEGSSNYQHPPNTQGPPSMNYTGSYSQMNQTLPEFPHSRFLMFTFMILSDWKNTLYQFYVIIDTIVTLVVLRTYRNMLKRVGCRAWDRVKVFLFGDKHDQRVSSVYKKRPSINQWTG